MASCPFPTVAQTLTDDTIKLGDDKKPAPAKSDPCERKHEVSAYRPGRPVTEAGPEPNHKSIQDAICHAGKGPQPLVKLYRDPYTPFFPGFNVNKPNLTISAEDADLGGAVAVAQSRSPGALGGACIIVNPGLAHQETTTTLVGFDFIADGAADRPCVVVKSGTLTLQKSNIRLRGATIAIDVAPTANLKFEGDDYEEHGVFAEASANAALRRIGVRAEESQEIALDGVTLEGLDVAVESRARLTRLNAARLVGNGVGVDIADAALRSAYAPTLEVAGGVFAENDQAAIRLSRRSFEAPDSSEAETAEPQAFRGLVTIAAGSGGAARFYGNGDGVVFDNAFPRMKTGADGVAQIGFTVDGAEFNGNSATAVRLPLPAEGTARIRNADFVGNGAAIRIDGAMNGALTVDGASKMTGKGSGISLDLSDDGEFAASLETVAGLAPAFNIRKGWNGKMLIAVEDPKTPPTFMELDHDSVLCQFKLDASKQEREAFRRAFKDFHVLVARRHISRLFGADSPDDMSEDEMKAAKRALCGA
jgi:hypothetical protein